MKRNKTSSRPSIYSEHFFQYTHTQQASQYLWTAVYIMLTIHFVDLQTTSTQSVSPEFYQESQPSTILTNLIRLTLSPSGN